MSDRKTVSKTVRAHSVKKSVVISLPKAAGQPHRAGNTKENRTADSRPDGGGARRSGGVAFVRDPILQGLANGRTGVRHSHGKPVAKGAFAELPARTEAQDRRSGGKHVAPPAGEGCALTEPDLHSVHRVGNDMLVAQRALAETERLAGDPEKRLAYAEKKVEESPGARERVEREAARGVDFADGEVLFHDLQALDISERELAHLRPPQPPPASKSSQQRRQSNSRAPTIEDFHEPFRGEERLAGPAEHDPDEVFRELEEARRERRRQRQGKNSAAVARDHEYFAKLKEWGML